MILTEVQVRLILIIFAFIMFALGWFLSRDYYKTFGFKKGSIREGEE